MKKTLFLMLLTVASMSTFAQLKVNSNGHVIVGTNNSNSNLNFEFLSCLTSSSQSTNNIGVFGRVNHLSSTGFSYGVYGVSSNGTGSGSYGVVGGLDNCTYGAGVMGTTSFTINTGVGGKYAGYFLGNSRVSGTLTVDNLVQTSDLRLKENITLLSEQHGRVLDKILDMNVIEYNYKKMLPSLILPDSVSVEDVMKEANIDTEKKHIGLIAQELQKLFPDLVEEGQDGYLAVNYVELVPVLIQAIQELQSEVDDLKGLRTIERSSSTTSIDNMMSGGNILFQNTPNPFKELTTINFKLANDATNACICIFDLQGKMLRKLPISPNDNSVSFNGYELGEGLYFYSLIVKGQEIDTKKMIISK